MVATAGQRAGPSAARWHPRCLTRRPPPLPALATPSFSLLQLVMEQVAGAYANALVEVAKKTSSLEAVHADVDALASMLKDNAVRRRACRSPAGALFPAWRVGVVACNMYCSMRCHAA